MPETIIEILMRRDGLTYGQAKDRFDDAKADFNTLLAQGNTEAAEEICAEHFGLEPDYLMELI